MPEVMEDLGETMSSGQGMTVAQMKSQHLWL